MKKVGIITFHASHNYGSMLQAYALQKVVEALGYTCEIINFRTKRQRNMYQPFPLEPRLFSVIKAFRFPRLSLDDLRKYYKFEKFLYESLNVTKQEFTKSQQLRATHFDYDVYISGSDQIWNTNCNDYDSAYFLDFVMKGIKVSYAPSMGPHPQTEVKANNDLAIKNFLSTYNALSVRDKGTADRIESITKKRPVICLDPTLLLNKENWYSMTDKTSYIQDDYILLYSPFYDEWMYDKSIELAEKYKLKVVVTLPNSYFRFRKKMYDVLYSSGTQRVLDFDWIL